MIEARIGEVAYRLQLPETLQGVHNVFHVSMRARPLAYSILADPPEELTQSLQVEQRPVRILDRQIRRLRSKEVPLVRVLWRSAELEEETWETEAEMRIRYPDLFSAQQVCALPAPGLVL